MVIQCDPAGSHDTRDSNTKGKANDNPILKFQDYYLQHDTVLFVADVPYHLSSKVLHGTP